MNRPAMPSLGGGKNDVDVVVSADVSGVKPAMDEAKNQILNLAEAVSRQQKAMQESAAAADLLKGKTDGLAQETKRASEAMRDTGAAAAALGDQAGGIAEKILRWAGVNAEMVTSLLVLPPVLLGVTAAAAAVMKAYSDGAAEAREFSKALILSGNAAGTSVQDLQNLAGEAAAATNATQGAASAALTQFAASGQVAADGLGRATEAALLLERAGVQAVDKTVAQFAELGKAPVAASLKLNEQYHYLTGAVFEQIQALESQGRADEAAALAQKTYGDEMARRAQQITQDLGSLEKAWKGLGDTAKSAWDKMLDMGREGSLKERIDKAREALNGGGYFFGGESEARAQLAVLEAQLEAQRKQAKTAAELSASEQAKTQWLAQGAQYLSKQQKMENEILQTRNLGVAAGLSEEKINERIAAIREKYAEKSKQGLKATRDELALLLNALDSKGAGLDSGYWKNLDTLHAAYRNGRLTLDEYRSAVEKLTTQQRFYKEETQALAKAEAERARAFEGWIGQETKHAASLAQANERLTDEIMLLGMGKEAQGEYRAAKLEAAAATEEFAAQALDEAAALLTAQQTLPDVAAAYYALAAAKRASAAETYEQAALTREKAAKEVAVKAAEDSAKAWEKFADDIERSLTDSLYRSFDAGENFGTAFVKSLQNTIKTAALKLAVQVVVGTGGSMVAQAADSVLGTKFSGSGALNNMSSIGSALNLFSAGGASGASLLAANTTGALGGDALGALIAGNASSWGVSAAGVEGMASVLGGVANASTATAAAATTAAGAAEGAATAAAGVASVASWALPAIGALAYVATNFKKIVGGQKSMGDGIDIVGSFNNDGFAGMMGQDWQKSGGWFGKKKNGVDWSALNPEIDAAFDDLYKGLKTGLIDLGTKLGDDSIAGLLDGFTLAVDQKGYIQNVSAVAGWIASDLVQGMLDKVAPVVNETMKGAGSTDWAGTLNTMAAQAIGVDQALKLIGTSLEDTFGKQKLNDVLWVTKEFARLFGGVEAMGNQLSAYVQNFYSESEINSKAWAAMGDQFAALGETMPATKAEFRSLVESLDLTTESGRQTFASMMALSPAFSQLAGAAEAAQQKLLAQRQSWQDKLDVLTGATTERQLQMQADLASTTDAATLALIRQVYAQEDLNAAAQAAAESAAAAAESAAAAAEEARQRVAAIASERAGLENQLLQAQGDTAALRARELAALDESNRALQTRIWALQDESAAAQAAAQQAAAVAQQRYGLETQLLQAQGDTAALRSRELAALDESNRALQAQIWSLQDASAAAAESARAEAERNAAAAAAASAAAQAAAAIASERDGLQKQLWQAQGNTAALRAAELAALNPANRALQEQIWVLEDLATAAQKAAQVESERIGLQKQLWQLQGNTAALREAELAALDPANRALQQQIWALEDSKQAADEWTRTWENLNQSLRDQAKKLRNEIAGGASVASLQAQFAIATAQARAGDAAAAGRLVGLSDQVMSAYGRTAGSSLDVARMAASLAGSLDTTANISDLSSPSSSGDSARTAQNTAAMASEIKQLRADAQAQAAAMARLLTEMTRIASRWDMDGMPGTRVEAA